MNIFEELAERLKQTYCDSVEVVVNFDRPLHEDGYWTFSMVFADEYLVSLAWNRHRGFQLTCGFDICYGVHYDEIYGSADAVFERIAALFKARSATEFTEPVGLAELRKLLGVKQGDLAARLDMTKGGLSQIENGDDLRSMKVETIRKLVASLGADLVLTAQFPNGERRILSLM